MNKESLKTFYIYTPSTKTYTKMYFAQQNIVQ